MNFIKYIKINLKILILIFERGIQFFQFKRILTDKSPKNKYIFK